MGKILSLHFRYLDLPCIWFSFLFVEIRHTNHRLIDSKSIPKLQQENLIEIHVAKHQLIKLTCFLMIFGVFILKFYHSCFLFYFYNTNVEFLEIKIVLSKGKTVWNSILNMNFQKSILIWQFFSSLKIIYLNQDYRPKVYNSLLL